jgi:hypothetical protein
MYAEVRKRSPNAEEILAGACALPEDDKGETEEEKSFFQSLAKDARARRVMENMIIEMVNATPFLSSFVFAVILPLFARPLEPPFAHLLQIGLNRM